MNPKAKMGLWLPKGSSSKQAEYRLTLVNEGNTVVELVGWSGLSLESLIDSGRRIGIIRRNIVRSFASPSEIIACSNLRVGLKPKGNLVYRWCCYQTKFTLPRADFRSWLKKLWQRCHTELFSIFELKRFESWRLTTTSVNLEST
jgi:hypothetical protein